MIVSKRYSVKRKLNSSVTKSHRSLVERELTLELNEFDLTFEKNAHIFISYNS